LSAVLPADCQRLSNHAHVILSPPPPPFLPLQLSSVLAGMHQLSWLNLPMVRATLPVLPFLNKLPSLEQLFLQVRGRGRCVCFAF